MWVPYLASFVRPVALGFALRVARGIGSRRSARGTLAFTTWRLLRVPSSFTMPRLLFRSPMMLPHSEGVRRRGATRRRSWKRSQPVLVRWCTYDFPNAGGPPWTLVNCAYLVNCAPWTPWTVTTDISSEDLVSWNQSGN